MAAADRDAYDLNWLLRLVERNGATLTSGLLGGLALALLYLLLATTKYVATARIFIDPRGSSVIELGTATSAAPVDTVAIDSQVEILGSARIAELTIQALSGPKNGAAPTDAAAKAEMSLASGGRQVEVFLGNLTVKRVGATNIIDVSFRDPDPQRAAQVANEVTRSYFNLLLDSEQRSRRQRTEALAGQAAKEKATVEQLDDELQSLRTLVGLRTSADTEAPAERQIAVLNQRLAAARAQERIAADRMAEFETKGPTRPDAVQLEKKHAELNKQLQAEEAKSGQAGAATDQIRAAIDETQQALERLRMEALKPLQQDLEAAKRAVAEVESISAKQREEASKVKTHMVELGEVERQATAAKSVYSALLARLNEAEAQQNLVVPAFTVVSAASPPIKTASPDRLLVLVFTTLAGLGLSAGYLAWRHVTLRPLRDPEEIDAAIRGQFSVALPLVEVRSPGSRVSNGAHRPPAPVPVLVRVLREAVEALLRAALSVSRWLIRDTRKPATSGGILRLQEQDAAGDYAQALFAIKNQIQARSRQCQVVTITSPRAGDGKSTLALSLADYGAKAGLNVLLIDGDLRTRALSKVIGRSKAAPLVAANAGIEQSVFRTENDIAFCDAAGGQPVAMPMERLAEADFAAFLSRMRQKYDLILIDAPALLDFVDAQVLLPLSDAALMVVDWGRTGSHDAAAAASIANRSSVRKLGTIVNRVPCREREVWLAKAIAVAS